MALPTWRMKLQPASYNGVQFNVDVSARLSGRRNVNHQFPKKNKNYLEDMGRQARRFTVTAYIIGPDYTSTRDDLISELEKEGPGQLLLPTEMQIDVTRVAVDQYSVNERRERGGICEFEMSFIEAGEVAVIDSGTDTPSESVSAADSLIATQVPSPSGGSTAATPLAAGQQPFEPTNEQSQEINSGITY